MRAQQPYFVGVHILMARQLHAPATVLSCWQLVGNMSGRKYFAHKFSEHMFYGSTFFLREYWSWQEALVIQTVRIEKGC